MSQSLVCLVFEFFPGGPGVMAPVHSRSSREVEVGVPGDQGWG